MKKQILITFLLLVSISLAGETGATHSEIRWVGSNQTEDSGLISAENDSLQMKIPAFPSGLQNPAMVVAGENIYLVGNGSDGNFFVCSAEDQYRYWKRLSNFPSGFADCRLFLQSNGEYPCIYAVATSSNITENYSRIFIYDLRKKDWSRAESNHVVLPLRNISGASTGSTYILFCQSDRGKPVNDTLYLFNTITKQFFPLQKLSDTLSVKRHLYAYQGKLRLVSSDESGHAHYLTGTIEETKFFSPWDYVVLIGYLLMIALIGFLFSRGQRTTADYFKADGRLPAWAVGISILGANLSAITFMSAPANTYGSNWFYFFPTIAVVLVIPVVNNYFIPFYRRLGVTSAYEYLDKRFDYLVRSSASVLYILSHIGRISIVLVLPSIALTVVTGISVNVSILLMGLITMAYTFKGGIKAVIWTDVLQVFLMFGGALLCLILIIYRLPMDSHEMWHQLRSSGKLNLTGDQLNLSTPNFLVVLLGGWTFNFLAFSTDQTTVQRYLTTKDESSARRSAAIGAWSAVPAGLLFMVIGSFLYLFYYCYPDRVNVAQESHDAIFPWYIVSELPTGIRGLLISGIFAAAMSSLSAGLNSVATALVTDFYKKVFSKKSDEEYLRSAKYVTLIVGLIAIGFSLFIANKGVLSFLDEYIKIMGLFSGGVGGVFLLGIFVKRANAQGALAGLILSAIGQFLVSSYSSIHFLLYSLVGLVLCFSTGWIVSLFFKQPSAAAQQLTFGMAGISKKS